MSLSLMALAMHGAMGAVAAAGGFALLFASDQVGGDRHDDGKQYNTNQDRSQIFLQP